MDELFDGNLCHRTKGSDPGRYAEWRGVFEGWLNELEREQGVKARRKAELAWGELLSFSEMAPWEISTREVRGWVEAQVRAGRSASTIQGRITAISKFYKSEDGAAGMPGDPTEGIQRPQPAARKGDTSTLSPGQAKSILQAARGDRSPLGRRDYALLCLALSSGQRLDPLRKLKIEAIEIDNECGWVQWKRGKAIHRELIPNTARQALAEHLANIEAGSTEDRRGYVFNPTCKVFGNGEVTWLRERALTRQQVLRIVRQYANWVGIEAEQVTWQTLRNTAIYLRLRRGETVEQIHALLGKAEMAKTREQLRKLVGKPQTIQWREGTPKDTTTGGYQRGRAGAPPRHGLHSKHLLRDALSEEEIDRIHPDLREVARLRIVEMRILGLMEQAAEEKDQNQALGAAIKLLYTGGTAVTRVARRLKELRKLEREMTEEFVSRLINE